jgi:hypothetical protein
MLLEDFSAKVGREDIFKPTIGYDSLHDIINDNLSNVKCSQNITFINVLRHLLMERLILKLTIFSQTGDGIQVYLMSYRSGQQIVRLTTI